MKKTYVSPLTDEVNVMTEAVMDGSIPYSDNEVDTTGGQLGNTHRGEWEIYGINKFPHRQCEQPLVARSMDEIHAVRVATSERCQWGNLWSK